jgi:hypothetical protein
MRATSAKIVTDQTLAASALSRMLAASLAANRGAQEGMGAFKRKSFK